jgi:glutamate-ammonia-ligase adenylyltransferase
MDFRPELTRQRIQSLIEDIVLGPSIPDVESRLREAGIPANASTAECFIRISRELGGDGQTHERLAVVLTSLLDSAHPAGALVNFLRYMETVGVSSTFLDTLAEGKPIREVLATLFGASQYMADIIIRNPGYLYWLMEKATWEEEETVSTYESALALDVARFTSVDGKLNAARRFQRRMLLKIGVKDLLGVQDVESTTAKLGDLAEAVARVTLEILWNDITPSAPTTACPLSLGSSGFAVLALGKLGGGELNYSSDIDLIYVCQDADDPWVEFYHKLATRLTEALSTVTAEGYLYRTDLRLRPDGASGPLVNSLTAMRIYYESRGRPWEFQAMLKARVIAGDPRVGQEFMTYVSGLLANPSVSLSPVEDIASMRTRIRENISDREKAFNIKLMEGGIRDVEFIVQTLQLLHGTHAPELRVPNTLEGIRRAYRAKLIEKTEMETMTRAYIFFRLVEHRLQMMHQIKTHSIPESHEEIELLARRVSRGPLGRYTYESFLSTLAAHLNKIRLLSESFFAGHGMPEAALLTLLPDEEDVAKELLGRYRFDDTKRALSVLQTLAYGSFPRLVDRTTRSSFQRLLPLLLEDCSATGDPDLTLVSFARLSEATGSESAFYSFLTDVPGARLIVRNLTGMSSVLTARLSKHPGMIDLLLEDPEFPLVAPIPPLSSLERFAENPTGANVENLQRDLADFLDRRLLAAWIIDDRSKSFPRTMSKALTATVREMISTVLDCIVGSEDGVALLALGSFGVGEPRMGSDADLVVVTEGRDIEQVTKHVHILNRVFSEGGLLKIDFRLRGEGANAPLVQDLETYKRYFARRMAPWEHVAFAKCAHWWGDRAVSDAFVGALLGVIAAPVTPERLKALIDMRRRLETLAGKGAHAFETKRSVGGRYDIEYLTAIGLAHSGIEFPLHADTLTRLELLTPAGVPSAGLLSRADRDALREAFELFHTVDFLLELQGFSIPNTPQKEKKIGAYLDRTFELLEIRHEDGVGKTIAEAKRRVRECYERFLGNVKGGVIPEL